MQKRLVSQQATIMIKEENSIKWDFIQNVDII